MDQLMELASKAGMSKEQGEAATGGIFSLVQKQMDDDSQDFQKITQQIPGLNELVSKHDQQEERATTRADGSLMGSAMSMLGGGGAGGLPQLLAMLQKQGIGAKEVNAFLPQVISFVKKQCGVDIGGMLGGISSGGGDDDDDSAQQASAPSAVSSALGGLFGKK